MNQTKANECSAQYHALLELLENMIAAQFEEEVAGMPS